MFCGMGPPGDNLLMGPHGGKVETCLTSKPLPWLCGMGPPGDNLLMGPHGGKVEIINSKGLRHFVRDGTAGGRELTEEYNYSLSIRLRSVFIFFP